MPRSSKRSGAKWFAAAVVCGAAAYAASAGITWYRYGRVRPARGTDDEDPLLDRFMPDYEVLERRQVRVAAPVDGTFQAACNVDLHSSGLVRALLKTRAAVLGSQNTERARSLPLLAQMQASGWTKLAEVPGREVVLGTVTRPWRADVVFHPIPADEFACFNEPGYVKIVTTLAAAPLGPRESMARTETRASTTDRLSRARFRRYWSFFWPGIFLIRKVLLGRVKRQAERHEKETAARALPSARASLR